MRPNLREALARGVVQPAKPGTILDARGDEHAPAFKSTTIKLDNLFPFEVPNGYLQSEVESILGHGRYTPYLVHIPKGFRPHRIIDIGARTGAFGMWCQKAWPEAWYDAVEMDTRLHRLLAGNLPAGGKVVALQEAEKVAYDVVRIADPEAARQLGKVCLGARVLIVDVLELRS